jgi:hypothetical protein
LKNCTASKNEYKTEWVLLSIVENTTYDFVLIHHKEYNGSLSGYVNDTSMNPIEGARIRVYFHETYEENYTDSSGYYNVNNIPICYCLKNCTASKVGYKTELVELSINENTTYDFVLAPNQPPNAPDIDGPTSGRVGVEYEWTIIAIDPDGDNITYYIDWGDECGGAEWHGPYPSGEEVILTHMYTVRNTFIINAMTVDEQGAESNWTYFEVTMPKNRAFTINLLFLRFLEQHPNLLPVIRYLLGL